MFRLLRAPVRVIVPGLKLEDLKVLIVAQQASAKFGGEAALPLHYFRQLQRNRSKPGWSFILRTEPKSDTSAFGHPAR